MLNEDQIRRICVPALMHDATLDALPSTFHWAGVLNISRIKRPDAFKAMGLSFCRGSVFTGPEGNGRHTYAWALANTLKKEAGYKEVYSIHGCDLDFEDPQDLQLIREYLQKLSYAKGKLVILLEQPELSPHGMLFQHQLVSLQQSLLQEGRPTFLMVIADSLDHVAPAMQRQFPHYHCPNPSSAAIAAFVDKMLVDPVPIKLEKVTSLDIIKAVQGLSWRQLTDLHTQFLRLIVSEYVSKQNQFPNVSEEDVYKNGLIQLSQATVKQILHSATIQRKQIAPERNAAAPSYSETYSPPDNTSPPAEEYTSTDETGLDPLEILRRETQGLMPSK